MLRSTFTWVVLAAVLAVPLSAQESEPEPPASPKADAPASQPAEDAEQAKDEREVPDLSGYSADVLRRLCENLYRQLYRAEDKLKAAETEIAELKQKNTMLRQRARMALREFAQLKQRIGESPELQKKLEGAEKIEQAVKDGKLTPGMTIAQANQAVENLAEYLPSATPTNGREVGQSEAGATYEWRIYRDNGPTTHFTATVRDGKIVSYSKY